MAVTEAAAAVPDSEVFVGIASVGFREHMLRPAIASLIDQVDHIGVYLNDYAAVPDFLRHPRITVVRSQDHGDVRDNGKFYFLDGCRHRFYASADDDIVYPADYISRLRRSLADAGPMSAVGVHGAVYPTEIVGLLWPRHLFHFSASLPYVMPVHVLGTGTTMFEQATWKLRYDEFGEPGMADLWFAQSAHRRKARMFVVNRNRQWLTPIDPNDIGEAKGPMATLFAEADAHGAPQVQLLHEFGVSAGGYERLIDAIVASDKFVETLSLSHILYLDDLRASLGWLPLDSSVAVRLRDRLRAQRSAWSDAPSLAGVDVGSYSDAAVAALTHDIEADTAEGAIAAIAHGARLAAADRAAWRALPLAIRFDTRTSRSTRVSAFLFEHALRRNDADSRRIWSLIERGDEIHIVHALEAERAGVNTNFQRLAALEVAGRKNPIAAAVHLRSYLEVHDWSATPDVLAWRRIFGRSFDLKEVQLLLATAAVRSGAGGMAARVVEGLRHLHPRDFEVQLMAAVVEAPGSASPSGTLMPALNVIDSLVTDVGLRPYADFVHADSSRSHWIHEFDSSVGRADVAQGDPDERVTVIMAVHNDVSTIEAAARSVLAAHGVDVELVIVDDASTDGTADVIAQLDDPRIVTLRNQHNVGPYVSRNRAILASSGGFITVADGDDWSHPERFAYQRERLTEQPELLGCTLSHIRVAPDGLVDLENNLLFTGHGPVSLMFKRFVVDQMGGFDHVRTRGDIEFIRRLNARFGDGAVAAFGAPLILATASPTSNSKRFTSETLSLYRRAANRWHSRFGLSDLLYVPLDEHHRAPFVAPGELIVEFESEPGQ